MLKDFVGICLAEDYKKRCSRKCGVVETRKKPGSGEDFE
jgi:hypothetical protein